MNINPKRALLFILIGATILLAGVAVFVGYNLSKQPAITPSDLTTQVICNEWTGVQCWYDNPSTVCNPPQGGIDPTRHMYGRKVCSGSQQGQYGSCDFYDACAPFLVDGDSCEGNYRGKDVAGVNVTQSRIRRLSTGEGRNFVGCEAVYDPNNEGVILGSSGKNCFCDESSIENDPNSGFPFLSGGEVRCVEDNNFDSCGANIIIVTPPPTNTPTVQPTNTTMPTPTPTSGVTPSPTVTNTPSPTVTGTPLPTDIPTPTPTPTPTGTIVPTNTPLPTIITPTTPVVTPSLPDTALFEDTIDKIILGIAFLIIGIILLVAGTDQFLAKFFNSTAQNLNGKYFDKEEIRERQKEQFEENLKKKD